MHTNPPVGGYVSRHEKLLLVTISDLIVETRSTNLNSLHRHLVYSILDTALWHTFKIFLKQKGKICNGERC